MIVFARCLQASEGKLEPDYDYSLSERERETTKEINKHRKKRKTDREGETARDREVRVLAS